MLLPLLLLMQHGSSNYLLDLFLMFLRRSRGQITDIVVTAKRTICRSTNTMCRVEVSFRLGVTGQLRCRDGVRESIELA